MTRRRSGACTDLLAAAALLLTLLPATALAHPGQPVAPHDALRAWTFAPAVLVGAAASGWCYARGVRALWRRAGRGRGVSRARAASFGAALAAVLIALVSPLDRMGGALFSAHMAQHLVLVMVAAPLAVLGDPLTGFLWALPVSARRRVGHAWRGARALRAAWRAACRAPVAWTVHVVTMWAWHVPSLYDAALRHPGVHVLEHASFLATALLFWWVALAPRARRDAAGVRLFYLFAAALQSTVLGAAITLARRPWYTPHFGTTAAWGLNPLEDQQLAGLLMWIPAGVVYLVPLVPLLSRVLAERPEREAQRLAAGLSARGTP